VRKAHDEGWDYNLIEAVDQPWKRHLEGTAGGYWGMLDANLDAKFPLRGPVAQRSSFMPVLAGSLAGVAFCLLLSLVSARIRRRKIRQASVVAMTGAWLGGALFMAGEHGGAAYRDLAEWMVLGCVALSGAAFALAHALGGRIRADFLTAWRNRSLNPRERVARLMSGLRLGILFAAATGALLLFVDPRYRDFPYWLYLIPLPTFLALTFSRWNRNGQEEGILAAVILFCGAGRWLMEPGNPEAQTWAALCLLLGACGLSGLATGRAGIDIACRKANGKGRYGL
jgi:glucan 1,3-beta-glucosidase